MIWHRPRLYRYRVHNPGRRFMWNRYGTQTIGLALVAGRYAYCAKWAWAGDTATIPKRQETPSDTASCDNRGGHDADHV